MRKIILIAIMLSSSICFSQNLIWEGRVNGAFNLKDAGTCIVSDRNGNVIVGGYITVRTISGDFPRGRIIKYNSAGNELWQLGVAGGTVVDVKTDSLQNIYAITEDHSTHKIDPNGTILLSMYQPDIGTAVEIDKKGNIITLGIRSNHYSILKYTPAGIQKWLSLQALGKQDLPKEIVTDDSNNIYVTGITGGIYGTIKLDSSGNLRWFKTFSAGFGFIPGATSLKVDKAGNVYVAGNNLNVIKYDPNGNEIWIKTFPGMLNNKCFNKLRLDDSANVYVTGRILTDSMIADGFITVKYDSSGQLKWSSQYSDALEHLNVAVDLAVDNNHNVYVTGTSNSDYLTIKYSSGGSKIWTMRYNGPRNDYDASNAICIDTIGGVYITGESIGNSLYSDILTIKYSSTTGIQNYVNNIPTSFSLSQNYPNPFNPVTRINYELPITNYVLLKVYDALGNEVQTLVNEKQNAGSYSVDFNAASLPSGIYFYKLITEKFSETKKMILIK